MDTTQIALLSLALGVLVGAGMSLITYWSYRMRAQAEEEQSAAIPPGITAVLGSMEDAACVVDASNLVLATSAAAERYGVSPDAVLDNPELRQLIRSARLSETPRTGTLRITRGGLSLDPRLVTARASALSARLMLLVIRDVTEQERLEQMRTDFVANTSHELKTPVGAVSLLAEAIESAADDPEQVRKFAARLSAEAGRLGRLTGRILSLSRLQAAVGVAEFEAVAIDEVVAASVEAHQVEADSAGVDLVRGGDRAVWVTGETQILVEAVSNLIANAIAYSPRGARVAVAAKVVDDVVEISVSDQGIGIAEADRERIFERFYRADEARSRRTGGTGLGLSIVKHATQRHGGEVRLWSRPGHGSTFTIRLPRIDAPVLDEPGKKKKKKKRRTEKTAKAAKNTAGVRARKGVHE